MQYRTGNLRGGFPRVRGLPDYDSFIQPVGALSPGAPRMPISPKLAPTDTPGVTRRLPASTGRLLPNCSLCAFTHNHASAKYVRAFTVSLLYLSGLSPYRCSTPNRTIHHQVSTWISLSNYPPNTIPPNTCISIHTTRFTFYIIYHVSLSRTQQQQSSPRKLRVTSHTPRLTSPRQRKQTS